jgi:hypothetical protein
MKKQIILGLALLGIATPANADITHKMQTSIQLTVDGAGSVANRIGSTYSVSGNNITLGTTGGLDALTAGSAVGYTAADYSVTNVGDAFSFSESFIEGDATPTATIVASGIVGSLPMLGSTTTTSGGVAGSLAGTIGSDGVMTIVPGGAGTTAIGQFITELSID